MLHIKHSAWHYTGDEFKYALHSAVHVHVLQKTKSYVSQKTAPKCPYKIHSAANANHVTKLHNSEQALVTTFAFDSLSGYQPWLWGCRQYLLRNS